MLRAVAMLALVSCMSLAQTDAPPRPWESRSTADCDSSVGYPAAAAAMAVGFGALGGIMYTRKNDSALLFDGSEILGTFLIVAAVVELVDAINAQHDADLCRSYKRKFGARRGPVRSRSGVRTASLPTLRRPSGFVSNVSAKRMQGR